jgi:hypothetical protein
MYAGGRIFRLGSVRCKNAANASGPREKIFLCPKKYTALFTILYTKLVLIIFSHSSFLSSPILPLFPFGKFTVEGFSANIEKLGGFTFIAFEEPQGIPDDDPFRFFHA